MKGRLLFGLFILITQSAFSQVVTTHPVFPRADQPIKITIDVSGTSLDHYAWNNTTNPIWLWTWIAEGCTENCDALSNIDPATDAQDVAKVTRINTNPDIYEIEITPTEFFNKPASELKKIGLKLKTRSWADNKQTDNDRIIELFQGYAVSFSSPVNFPVFKNQNETIDITANASASSDFTLSINGVQVASALETTSISYIHTITESTGTSTVVVTASTGTESKEISFTYLVRSATLNEPRPLHVIDGINYQDDPTKVALSLWAPGKTSVYVIGDFSDWKILPEFQMKKDGEHFWTVISGLIPGQEYGFQYLVDESIRIADPYADKILDPDDQYIPSSIYPDLKPFPSEAYSDQWYFNRVAVLQTNQTEYEWQVTDFQKPDSERLVIYELLIRDFFDESNRSYQNLIDTLGYFKRLGINAIELMPIMEFNGNDSWGYNPTFMFAPDKAYGPKNKLKAFIDECHKNGIAVILDIAMNHHDTPNPYVLMDYNFSTHQPTANNKWFNVSARHPYNVFHDMNHESAYTKTYLDTVNHYWLNEYKIDGFRFDLTKGFTQNNRCSASTSNESCFGQRDNSRISILKRMGDVAWGHTPDAYLILEHFADNSEETELADYGFMIWGNSNHAYSQNAMGFSSDSDIGWIWYKARNWNNANLIGYMESHDEERMMYRNIQSGNASGNYSIKDVNTGLNRVKAAASFFFTVPGPKMIWQFGELGYDISINMNGRVGVKPVKWDYYTDPERVKLFQTFANLISLRNTYDVFHTTDFTILGGSSLVKQITLRNESYTATPSSVEEMNVHIIGNFNVNQQTVQAAFPHTGEWYHYFSGGDVLNVSSASTSIDLEPGEFRLYTDVKLPVTEPELMPFVKPNEPILTSVEEGKGKVIINWQDHSDVESEFEVFRKKTGEDFQMIGTVSANAIVFNDTKQLEALTTYDYYIQAVNNFGMSRSNILSITTTDVVTSSEKSILASLHVYPNPAHQQLKIQYEHGNIHSVSLTAVHGREININRSSENVWDIAHIPPGLYIIHVKTNQGVFKEKVIKN